MHIYTFISLKIDYMKLLIMNYFKLELEHFETVVRGGMYLIIQIIPSKFSVSFTTESCFKQKLNFGK